MNNSGSDVFDAEAGSTAAESMMGSRTGAGSSLTGLADAVSKSNESAAATGRDSALVSGTALVSGAAAVELGLVVELAFTVTSGFVS